MAAPHLSEIVTTTIRNRSRQLADNVSNNTSLLKKLKMRGKVKPFDGGTSIIQELDYAENQAVSRYSGYETIDIRPSETFTSAEFNVRQIAVTVSVSGLEELQNSGRSRQIELVSSRVTNAERTMMNTISGDVYSDGTEDAGKQIDGLQAAILAAPTTGTYGGISRVNHAFWRSAVETGVSSSNIQNKMQALWVKLVRGQDMPDLITADNIFYGYYWKSLTDLQRFTTDPKEGAVGFRKS